MAGVSVPFERGLAALTRLTDGSVFVCTEAGSTVTAPSIDRVHHEEFSGPHPSGTAGLHIHTLDPVCWEKTVWHVSAQDVVAIGRLFETGALDVARVVSLAGPAVTRPRLLRTRLGASVDELVTDELDGDDTRVVSGSVLSGRAGIRRRARISRPLSPAGLRARRRARARVHGVAERWLQQVLDGPDVRVAVDSGSAVQLYHRHQWISPGESCRPACSRRCCRSTSFPHR